MKQLKGFILGVICTALFMAMPALAETIEKTLTVLPDYVNVKINGEAKDVRNFVNEGTTYIALRDVAELLGCTVDWDDATRTASITSGGASVSGPAITVNGTEISGEEFSSLYNSMKAYYQGYNVPESEIVGFAKETLVSEVIIKDKAKELNIDEAYIKNDIETQLKTMDLAYGEEVVDQLIVYQGYASRDEYIEKMINSQLYEEVFLALEKTEPQYKEVVDGAKAYYEENKEQYKKPSVQVKHILIPTTDEMGTPLTGDALKAAEALAKDIKKKVNKDNFDQYLKEHNNDPGLTEEGYYVDANTNFVTEFKTAALALKKAGDISEVVKTSYGFHIIIALDVYEYTPFDVFKESYVEEKFYEVDEAILKSWIENADVVYNEELIKNLTK